MKTSYHDIIMKLEAPCWWDWMGVPRYTSFHPGMQDVDAKWEALLEAECQACGSIFTVGCCGRVVRCENLAGWGATRDFLPWDKDGFVYGGPPWHGCPCGETMNVLEREVLQVWVREGVEKWRREPDLEGKVTAYDA